MDSPGLLAAAGLVFVVAGVTLVESDHVGPGALSLALGIYLALRAMRKGMGL